jgi:hypothetical protein
MQGTFLSLHGAVALMAHCGGGVVVVLLLLLLCCTG